MKLSIGYKNRHQIARGGVTDIWPFDTRRRFFKLATSPFATTICESHMSSSAGRKEKALLLKPYTEANFRVAVNPLTSWWLNQERYKRMEECQLAY